MFVLRSIEKAMVEKTSGHWRESCNELASNTLRNLTHKLSFSMN